jgi:uncharacterized protein (DUF58 family)
VPTEGRTAFPLVPKHRLSGLPFGLAPSKRRGRGTDVAGSRPYVPGDPMSTIDWRASARLSTASASDQFVVRQRFADEAPRVVVLCDRRPSMALYPPGFPWLSKPAAVSAAVDAIVLSAVAARGTVGYLDYGGGDPSPGRLHTPSSDGGVHLHHSVGEPLWIPPRGRAEWQRISDRQTDGEPYDAPEDTLALGLDFLGRLGHELPSGTFLFVVSDFLAPPPPSAWLTAGAHRWDVVPVVVQDPVWEQSFPLVGPLVLPLADPRDGRLLEVRLTRREAAARRQANEQARAGLLAELASLGFEPVLLDTSDPVAVDVAFLEWAEQRRRLRSRR